MPRERVQAEQTITFETLVEDAIALFWRRRWYMDTGYRIAYSPFIAADDTISKTKNPILVFNVLFAGISATTFKEVTLLHYVAEEEDKIEWLNSINRMLLALEIEARDPRMIEEHRRRKDLYNTD